jgi:uncharacterized protein YerC
MAAEIDQTLSITRHSLLASTESKGSNRSSNSNAPPRNDVVTTAMECRAHVTRVKAELSTLNDRYAIAESKLNHEISLMNDHDKESNASEALVKRAVEFSKQTFMSALARNTGTSSEASSGTSSNSSGSVPQAELIRLATRVRLANLLLQNWPQAPSHVQWDLALQLPAQRLVFTLAIDSSYHKNHYLLCCDAMMGNARRPQQK